RARGQSRRSSLLEDAWSSQPGSLGFPPPNGACVGDACYIRNRPEMDTAKVNLAVLGGAGSDGNSVALKPPVEESTLVHKHVLRGPFWQKIPAYANVSEAEFLDHKWQAKHTITNLAKLIAALGPLASPEFVEDATRGFSKAPMSVRVSPYLLSLIDWSSP